MEQFVINTQYLDDDSIASGHARVTAKVRGYWSSDSITLYVRREFGIRADDGKGEVFWKLEMSHSSGGRDPKEVESDLVAEANFGAAMIALAEYGENLKRTKLGDFEMLYQQRRAKAKAEREAQAAAEQAKIDADRALGVSRAEDLVDTVVNQPGKRIVWFKRGNDEDEGSAGILLKRGAKTTFYVHAERVARKELVNTLANSSHRTTWA